MIRVSVLYPGGDDVTFDHDYYRNSHVPLVTEAWGIKRAEIDKGVRLCTVTKQGNLAMYEITGLTPGEYSFEVPTVQGKLTLWEITE